MDGEGERVQGRHESEAVAMDGEGERVQGRTKVSP